MAVKALTGVQRLRGLVNAELKKLDTEISGLIVASWSLNPVHLIAQGDTYNQRDGNAVLVRALNWKGSVVVNELESPIQVCLVVLQDTQQIDSTVPNGTDIFEANTPYTHLNHKYVGRFKILLRKNMVVSTQVPERTFNYNIPMYSHLRYSGVLSTTCSKNGLYTAIISTSITHHPQIVSTMRTSYHDN